MSERTTIQSAAGHKITLEKIGEENPTGKTAIILPGLAYTADHPILNFSALCADQNQFQPLLVRYDYGTAFEGKDTDGILQLLSLDASLIATAVRACAPPEHVVIIGKSLGCLIAALMDDFAANSRAIAWLTPNITHQHLMTSIIAHRQSFVGIGDQDKYFAKQQIDKLKVAKNVTLSIAEGLNHGMEARNNVVATINGQKHLIDNMNSWMKDLTTRLDDLPQADHRPTNRYT